MDNKKIFWNIVVTLATIFIGGIMQTTPLLKWLLESIGLCSINNADCVNGYSALVVLLLLVLLVIALVNINKSYIQSKEKGLSNQHTIGFFKKIKLESSVQTEKTLERNITHAYLYVYNNGKNEITDCRATLEIAKNLDGVAVIEKERLSWAEKYQTNDCQISIPANDFRKVDVANDALNIRFSVCQPTQRSYYANGLYSQIKIRVDYKSGGKSQYAFFDGYLYLESVTTTKVLGEIPRQISPYTIIIFDEGDWKKDKNIPKVSL